MREERESRTAVCADDTHLCSCSEREEDAICLTVPVAILEGLQDEIPLKALIMETGEGVAIDKIVSPVVVFY